MTEIKIKTDDSFLTTSLDLVPDDFIKYGFEFEIDIPKIWKLEAKVVDFPLEKLLWHLNIQPWEYNNIPFQIGPLDVFADPSKYHYHNKKIQEADTSYPIDISFNNGRWIIIDGLHRLCSLIRNKHSMSGSVAVRIHTRETVLGCVDLDLTQNFIYNKYRKSQHLKQSAAKPQSLASLSFNPKFSEKYLALTEPLKTIKLSEMGFEDNFSNALECKIGYTSSFQFLSNKGVNVLNDIVSEVETKQSTLNNITLTEYGALAYQSEFIKKMAKNDIVTSFLSRITQCKVESYARDHFLASLNIGKYAKGANIRDWHRDYQSLNLIISLDSPSQYKKSHLEIFHGTTDELNSYRVSKEVIPDNKKVTVDFPSAGSAILIQGSLINHRVLPLGKGEPNRRTLVLGYRPLSPTGGVVEHTKVTPDHPLCKYPEMAKQATSNAMHLLAELVNCEWYTDDISSVIYELRQGIKPINEAISELEILANLNHKS